MQLKSVCKMDITTARLHIRDLIEADAESLNHLRTDPAVYTFQQRFGPETLAQTLDWIVRTKFYNERPGRDSHNCSVMLRSSGEITGWIGFGFCHPQGKAIGDVGIGYALRSHFWNQGYMTEALRATLNFIFCETDAENARATCHVENIASARVMEKAGMRFVEFFADPDEPSPDKANFCRYQLSREMWSRRIGGKFNRWACAAGALT
jgi:ribosomal-protein-alanine N-acetyltransferase